MGGRESAGTGPHRADWDFFVSYTRADRKWAEWISWQLEASGYRVLVQAWDMVPGSHWPASMQDGIQYSQRTVAVVSSAYLSSVFGEAEWEAAWLDDPRGFKRKLIPVRVEDCPRPGLLGQVVSIDLFNLGMQESRELLLDKIAAVKVGREKPAEEPEFPGTHVPEVSRPSAPPAFPGSPGRAAGLVASSASPGIRASRGRAQWHASIETAEGDTKGSGILVSARTVLTCARVVDGLDDVRVTFPGVPGVAGLPARVIDLHSRAESGGRGDVALVELANSAPVEP